MEIKILIGLILLGLLLFGCTQPTEQPKQDNNIGFVDSNVSFDNNNLQSLEKTSNSHPGLYPIEEKFKSFGWQSFKCDGHNLKKIYQLVKNKKRNKIY